MEKVYAHIDAQQASYIDRLGEAVAIQSVSGDPAKRPECIRMMHYARDWLQRLGATVQLHDIGNQTHPSGAVLPLPPILTATLGTDASKKTVCIYGHLDVQPADKSDGWDTEPFQLVIRDGKMFGRGSTDDKGPVLSWLYVIEAYQAVGRALPVNLKFVLEGMEESGSEGLEAFVAAQAGDFLKDVDFTCISDNYWLGPTKPCLTYGLRGICYFFLEVTCAQRDLHSGVYGGPVHEGMTDLVKIFASFHDADGNIAVKGIQDLVRPLTDEERATYGSIDFNPELFRAEVGANALRFPDKERVLQARWRNPTLSIHGVEGAFSGAGTKTVIPGRVVGKFSLRIVPDMTPEDVHAKVVAHVERVVADLRTPNKVKVSMAGGAKAWLGDVNNANFVAARRAVATVYGEEPDLTREGGSIPVTLWFEEATKHPVLLLPVGACDDSAHSTNEKFNVDALRFGPKVMAAYLEEISA